MTALLAIDDLSIRFDGARGQNRALNGVSLTVDPGEIVAVVGESGCGKTITGLSVLQLLPDAATITGGSITVDGDDVMSMPGRGLRQLRGGRVAMIFQDPTTSLNPVFTIGSQLRRVVKAHTDLTSSERHRRITDSLTAVGLADTDRLLASYPHQLSGGMKQRIMIAMALVGRPRLLIADEPTTALDVTVQSQILTVLMDVRDRFDVGIMLISHDLGVVSQVADRVAVMYAGTVVETGPTEHFARPEHPYTAGLVRSIPTSSTERGELQPIGGIVPTDPGSIVGCVYAQRCEYRMDVCASPPPLRSSGEGARVACHLERLP